MHKSQKSLVYGLYSCWMVPASLGMLGIIIEAVNLNARLAFTWAP